MTRPAPDRGRLATTGDRRTDMLDWLEVEAEKRDAELPAVPDFAEPLHAWRLWALEDVRGSARLRSLYRRCVWPAGVPFAASCYARRFRLWRRSEHEAPVDTCSCGIYAVHDDRISRLWRDSERPPGFSLVIGSVSLWGDVVECEHGWRSSFAYPSQLFVPCLGQDPDQTAAGLADYGVPVEVIEARTVRAALDAVAERAV
jgi:hypothetical protein